MREERRREMRLTKRLGLIAIMLYRKRRGEVSLETGGEGRRGRERGRGTRRRLPPSPALVDWRSALTRSWIVP